MAEVLPIVSIPLRTPTANVDQPKSTAFTGTEGVYMLPHHVKEIERLQKQHRFMNATTGGFLLLTPNLHGDHPLRILDAGAADGELRLKNSFASRSALRRKNNRLRLLTI
jgi:hypothetical protein